jgi:hypothetical protein
MQEGTQQTISYRSYINSDEWKDRRVTALQRSGGGGGSPACEMCGLRGDNHKNPRRSLGSRERRYRVDGSNGLEVHHLHYETLGSERPEDLIVLCTDVLYYEMHDARVEAAMQNGDDLPPVPEEIGCHERCHADPLFRAAVERVAARRH